MKISKVETTSKNNKIKLNKLLCKLEKLEEENRKRIETIYENSKISILDLYIPNQQENQKLHFEKVFISDEIKKSLLKKNKLQKTIMKKIEFLIIGENLSY